LPGYLNSIAATKHAVNNGIAKALDGNRWKFSELEIRTWFVRSIKKFQRVGD
jgi:hypothetical protein